MIATDADREGEMIARGSSSRQLPRTGSSACGCRRSMMRRSARRWCAGSPRPRRSAVLGCPAASRADWLIGMNLSHCRRHSTTAGLHRKLFAGGWVQTPTLKWWRIVTAGDHPLVSVPFWAVEVTLSMPANPFIAVGRRRRGGTDDAGRCLQQPVAQQAAERMRAAGNAQVGRSRRSGCAKVRRCRSTWARCGGRCSSEVGPDVQGDAGHRPGAVRNAQGDDLSAPDSGYLPESMLAEVQTVLDSLVKTDPACAR